MPVFLVLLEMPAIVVGILLARGVDRNTPWRVVGRVAAHPASAVPMPIQGPRKRR